MHAVKITASGEVTTIDFPDDETKQYPIMRDAVGGYIERVAIRINGRPFDMWVNEEGLLRHLPYNAIATFFYEESWNAEGLIVGDALILKGNNYGDTLPLLMADVYEVMSGVENYETWRNLDLA